MKLHTHVFVGALFTASVAHAQPAEPAPSLPRALVFHVAPHATPAGEPIELVAQIDAPYAEALAARWRIVGESGWRDAAFERSSAGGWFATLPEAREPGVEYFIVGRDATQTEVAHFASAAAPHVVRVVPSLADRLEELDAARLGQRMNQVAVEAWGHNFGNRYDLRDDFLRGEATYMRRILRPLHHVAFGFGSIQGSTPRESAPMADEVDKGLRYGFAEVRVRAHPSVFFDLRGVIGASHDGLTGGVRAAVTFGKPWRSSLTFAGEVLGDVGPSAWVRLQWDTVPPLLMGASIVRSELPGAIISSAGLYVALDATYPATDWLGIKAQLSYGSRDGAAHVGGGLGTTVDF